jgi:hypothetical protein
MQIQEMQPNPAAVALRKSEADEYMRLIVKLRWIGLDDEADRLQRVMHAFGARIGAQALAGPTSTD